MTENAAPLLIAPFCRSRFAFCFSFSASQFQLATITAEGSKISKPYSVSTQWELKRQINPSSAQ